MSDGSKIQWLARPGTRPATWNPVTGCTPRSDGCINCYAARMSRRLAGRFGYPNFFPFRVTFHPDKLAEPAKWRKPRTVFCVSMGDLWHQDVRLSWRQQVFEATAQAPQHTYLFLTKRPERVDDFPVLPNHWLGTSIENQQTADERIPYLLEVQAAVRFVSCEPLLGAIDLGDEFGESGRRVDWVIIGAETGPGRRPCKSAWVRSLIEQANNASVPVFVKQLEIPSTWLFQGKVTSNPADWPNWTRRREWPVV